VLCLISKQFIYIYLERDCGKAMDVDKFKELARLKAFSEGYMKIEPEYASV